MLDQQQGMSTVPLLLSGTGSRIISVIPTWYSPLSIFHNDPVLLTPMSVGKFFVIENSAPISSFLRHLPRQLLSRKAVFSDTAHAL